MARRVCPSVDDLPTLTGRSVMLYEIPDYLLQADREKLHLTQRLSFVSNNIPPHADYQEDNTALAKKMPDVIWVGKQQQPFSKMWWGIAAQTHVLHRHVME